LPFVNCLNTQLTQVLKLCLWRSYSRRSYSNNIK